MKVSAAITLIHIHTIEPMTVIYTAYIDTDLNECLEESICPAGSRCINTIGSYTCTCDAGYFLFTINGDNTCSGKIIFDAKAQLLLTFLQM